MLLDAGEGTCGQLWRQFGEKTSIEEIVGQLNCVFITHNHADHHLGLIQILAKRPHDVRTMRKSQISFAHPLISHL